MVRIVKILLAIMLFLCLFNFPYAYYLFVRWSAMIGFGYLAYIAHKDKQSVMTIAFVLLTILFQPFEKIALGRMLWNIVDVIVAVGLIISLFFTNQEKRK